MTKLILVSVALLSLVGCGKDDPEPLTGLISTNKSCIKVFGGKIFEYRLVTYSTGDVFVTCSISDDLSTYSDSALFKASQEGAATGACILVYDIDAASAGFWRFETSGATATITYNDSGSASNGNTVPITESDCVSH